MFFACFESAGIFLEELYAKDSLISFLDNQYVIRENYVD